MRRPPLLLTASVLLIALLAGCVAPEERHARDAGPDIEIDPDRPDTSFGDVITGPAAAPDLNATLDAAPVLVPGEWWKIRFQSSFFAGTPDFVRVVADTTDEGYVIGMPHEGWFKEAIAFHSPAFGDIGADLSYELHNERFEPVRFPLVQDATWQTVFGTSKVIATVESTDAFTATVVFEPAPSDPEPTDPVFAALNPFGDIQMRLVYDARQHDVVRFESPIGTWEVLEHGYDFTGWVTVPRGLHTAIDYGQFLPATPGEPVLTRTETIDGGFNRLTLMHGIYAFGPGAYHIRDVAPNGTEYLTESNGETTFTVAFHETTDPDGEWLLEDLVAGPGGTYTMGMAYHQFDIRLPDGTRRSDHSHPVIR